jgi:MFS family permease
MQAISWEDETIMTDIAAASATAPGAEAGLSARDRRDFRCYLSGYGSATFGTAFTGVAVSALAVNLFHVTGGQAGVLAAGSALPALAVAPVAGLAAERMARPRRILIASDLASATVVGGCALAVAIGAASFGWLLALVIALGSLSAISQTLLLTHLNSLRTQSLPVTRARMQTVSYLSSLSANAAVGPVISAVGPAVALTADAVCYLGSAGALRAIAAPDRNPALEPGKAAGPFYRDIIDGFRILFRGRLRPVMAYALVAQSAFAGIGALKALFLLQTLRIPLYLYSLPGFCAAGLAALGSILTSRALQAGWSPGRVAAGWWACGAAGVMIVPAATGSFSVKVIMVCVGIAVPVMCYAAANIAVVALFSEEIPESVLGRAIAAAMVTATAAATVGSLLGGLAADLVTVRGALWICAAIGLAGVALLRPLMRRGSRH